MTDTLLQYQHPAIKAWQSAYEEYFGAPAPKVSRRTSKGFVIHGENGDSRRITESNLLRITKALRTWAENRKGMRG